MQVCVLGSLGRGVGRENLRSVWDPEKGQLQRALEQNGGRFWGDGTSYLCPWKYHIEYLLLAECAGGAVEAEEREG